MKGLFCESSAIVYDCLPRLAQRGFGSAISQRGKGEGGTRSKNLRLSISNIGLRHQVPCASALFIAAGRA